VLTEEQSKTDAVDWTEKRMKTPAHAGTGGNAMKKLSVVLYVVAALVLLLGGPSGTSGALAGPLPNKPASTTTTVATAGGMGILSIPAAAFTPYEDGYDFQNDGRYLRHFHGPGGSEARGLYYAPVNLPQGAKVTKMTFYYRVENVISWTATAKLQGTLLDSDTWFDMATIVTTGTGTQFTSDSTSSISSPTIGNSLHTYWVVWDLPWISGTEDVWGCGVTIEYTPPATVTGTLSIPAAAFTPFEDGYDYENDGRYLFTTTGVSGPYGWYLAPVHLPQGATVTAVIFHWYDANASSNAVARLQRTRFEQGNYEDMAYAESVGSGGYGSTTDGTIFYATIDNSQYAYWVIWDIPAGSALKGCAVVIHYTFPTTGTGTGIISVPAASFKLFEDGYDYENDGRYLKHFNPVYYGYYQAQVIYPAEPK
jgi:hypothetical protein